MKEWYHFRGKGFSVRFCPSNLPETSYCFSIVISSRKLKRFRRNKDKAWSEFDIEPCYFNLNYALKKQNQFEKDEINSKLRY